MNSPAAEHNQKDFIEIIQQNARRWASDYHSRNRSLCAPLDSAGPLVVELAERGWLAPDLSDWGEQPEYALSRLAQAIARDAGQAFLAIAAHFLGTWLCRPSNALESSDSARDTFACSPFWDLAAIEPTIKASLRSDTWVLNGVVPWVVNMECATALAVVAQIAEGGDKLLLRVPLPHEDCFVAAPHKLVGLRGVPVCDVALRSVELGAAAVMARGTDAVDRLMTGSRAIRWATVGLLDGLLECCWEQANEYANLRRQGGRLISEHYAIKQRLSSVALGRAFLDEQLAKLEKSPDVPVSFEEVYLYSVRAADAALQIFGGYGYICPGLPERCWRDVRQAALLVSDVEVPRPRHTEARGTLGHLQRDRE
jgi:alkylation response protein AidB-like acyl-CoA dehydrogenase